MGTRELRRLISEKKKEARELINKNELDKADKIKNEIEDLKQELEEVEELEREEMQDFIAQRNGDNKSEIRACKNAILPNEKFSKRNNSKELRLDKLIRGMAGKGWEGAEKEHEHYRSMTSADNTTIIPVDLMGQIIDVARTNSALFGRIPIVPMNSNNLTVAVQTTDPTVSFTEEGSPLSESGPSFMKVNMEGKTIGVIVNVTEQLLDSADNLEQQLINSCGKAIALAIDKALLYGNGTTEIKGISLYEGINKATHTGNANYDMFIKGIKECKKVNITPTDIVYSTDTGMDIAMLKDTNGQYILKPSVLGQYNFTESNNIKNNESYIYDSNCLLLGIHKNINIQWGVTGDDFKKITKSLRVYARIDLAVVNPKGITQITINNG